MPQRPLAEPHTGLRLVLSCQKARQRTPMALNQETTQDAGGSVWLRVAHPVTWEEMTSTERDGDNSDSLPAHLSQSWGFDALAVVDGSRGGSPPRGKGTPPPPREGRATQGAASRSPVLYHV